MSTAVTKFSSNQLDTILSDKSEELITLCGGGDIKKGRAMLTRELSFAAQAANKNSALAKASPQSVAMAVYNTVISGLTLNPHLELCDVLPYDNSSKDANGNWVTKTEAQMQPRYGGLLKLAADTGAFKDAPFTACVYKGDEFSVTLGSNRLVIHTPTYLSEKDEDITHVYTIFSLANGGSHIEVMSIERVKKTMRKSKSWKKSEADKKNSIWHTSFPEMAMKTCLKRGLKTIPKSSFNMETFHRLGAALAADNTDYDANQLPPGNVINPASEEKLIESFKANPTEERFKELKGHLENRGVDPEQMQRIISRATEILDSIPLDPPAPEDTTTETPDEQ
jgi:phage RecT family recombinase